MVIKCTITGPTPRGLDLGIFFGHSGRVSFTILGVLPFKEG